jgi:iron complex outermembrane receptor protein
MLLATAHGFTQNTNRLRGRVVDSYTHEGISQASVLIQGTWRGAATDEDGYFNIAEVPDKEVIVLVVKHIGYTESTKTIKRQEDDTENIHIALTPTTLRLADEVVVMAERSNDAYIQNALRSNPDGEGRILRDIPGLQAVARAYVAYDPVIRGMKEDQINVTIDGIKIEPACHGRMDPATAYADLAELEALTITKGPFEVTGLGAGIGGHIDLAKLRPVYQDENTIRLTGVAAGSYNSVTTGDKEHLRLGMSTARLGLQLQLSRQTGDNYQSARSEVPFSAYENHHIDAMLGFRPARNHELRLAHYRSDGEDTGYPALPMDTRDHKARLYGFEYIVNDGPLAVAQIQLKAYRSDVTHLMDNLDRPAAMMREMTVLGETETTGGNAVGEWRFRHSHLKVGLDLWRLFATARRDMLSKATGMQISNLIWPDVTMGSAAAFAEFGYDFTTDWNLTAGTRVANVKSRADSLPPDFLAFYQLSNGDIVETDVAAHVRLNYDPKADWAMSLSLGHGVRPPGHKERYGWYTLNQMDLYDYIGNPQLKAEKNFAVNLALRYHAKNIQVQVEPYFNRWQDFITGEVQASLPPQSMGARGVKVYTNIGSARIYGVDLDLNWQLPAHLTLFSNVSFADGRDLEREAPLPEMPPLSTLTGLRYVSPTNLFWAQIETRAAAPQNKVSPFTGENETPGFTVYNLRGGIRLGSHFHVQSGIENITEVFYHEHLDRNDIPQSGRNFYIKTVILL